MSKATLIRLSGVAAILASILRGFAGLPDIVPLIPADRQHFVTNLQEIDD